MGTTARGLAYPSSTDDVRVWEDIQALADSANTALDKLSGDSQALSSVSAGGTSTSATYANMPAPSSRAITKVNGTSTRLRAEFSCGSYCTGSANTEIAFAVQVNGTDYDISKFRHTNLSTHGTCPTGVVYVSGLAAGSYTVQARWKRTAGSGTMVLDASDWITLDVQEVI